MARVRMVTRTVKTNRVKAMAVNTDTETIEYKLVYVVGEYDEKTITKKVKALVEDEKGITFVKIMEVETTESVYGMTEDEFMLWAKPIDR